MAGCDPAAREKYNNGSIAWVPFAGHELRAFVKAMLAAAGQLALPLPTATAILRIPAPKSIYVLSTEY